MIMGYIDDDQLEWVITNEIEFFVFEEDRLNKAIEIAKKIKKLAKIHIELETGMNRTGFPIRNVKNLFNELYKNRDHIIVSGVCSHLAGAESIANYKRIKDQYEKFKR